MGSFINSSPWVWSVEHKNHYMCTYDVDGQPVFQWAQQAPSNPSTEPFNAHNQQQPTCESTPSLTAHVRADSVSTYDVNMAPSAPIGVRSSLRYRGTPERGWYEPLDSSYCMRTKGDAHRFFVQGRVFSMLWAETASPTMARNGTENTAVTVGRFGENVYSQIRRFVILKVNRKSHFVYACPISTYGNQGTMKRGCTASEHTIVYLTGTQPTYIPGEWERGMTKDPIEIVPKDATEIMHTASRLRLGKIHSIEWNVKVREIGQVAGNHMSKLVKYFREEENNGYDNDYVSDEDEEAIASSVSAPQTGYPHT